MPTWVDRLLNSQFVQLGLAALAFLIALWLVVVIARMLMGGRLRLPGGRTRQARLGIVDAFDLDRQRQLIIVRRDNTEHLIMIGGPNDLVIESEIVRVESRDFREVRRDKGVETGGEMRVPAPAALPSLDGFAPGEIAPGQRAEEPLLPMPLPAVQPPQATMPEAAEDLAPARPAFEPSAPKGPTFPLPSRRPPSPPLSPPTLSPPSSPSSPPSLPAAERRPPPGMPDRSTRAEEPAREDALPDVAAPIEPPTRPGPRPLPPRTPLRPLKRATPQLEPGQPPRRIEPAPSPPPIAPSGLRPAGSPKPAPMPVPNSPPAAEDGLESLEEEMAKLLGR